MPEEDDRITDRLLRALAGEDLDDRLPSPGDPQLRAYREGRLTAEETGELEGRLARSAAGRRRLLELAGIDHSLPLRRVRKAVLGAADHRRRTAFWTSVAAVAASIIVALLVLLPRPHALPDRLAYDVSARGLAEERSTAEVPGKMPGEVRAYPATTVRILLRPRGDSSFAGATFALFRREGGALRRVRQPDEARLTSDRGSATFTGAAGAMLAARAPGVYPLYVVISAAEPPALVKPAPGQDPAGALRSSGRLVYPVTITLLRDEPAAGEGAP